MLNANMYKQKGIGLAELMIGTVVGLIITAGVITIYTSMVKSSTETLKAAKLNHELSSAINIMTSDLRRAGYWGNAQPDDLTNPFMVDNTTNLDILDSGACVLYTYDLDSNGSASTTTEYFGFKLLNNRIYMRNGAGTGTSDCNDGTWEAITDDKIISISTLTFHSTNSKCLNSSSTSSPQTNWSITGTTATDFPCRDSTGTGYSAPTSGDVLIETRQVTITLEGQLVSDSSVTKKITESVRVRNDRIIQN